MAGLSFIVTRNGNLTLLLTGGFLFSGLMFGPDLDLVSRPYKRWGLLRWIWLPYQKALRHRSFLSHGLIVGTTLRLLYLYVWIFLLVILPLSLLLLLWGISWGWQLFFLQVVLRLLYQSAVENWPVLLALFIGLELGAMSHSLSDWGGSTHKRIKKQGLSALKPRPTPKRKPKRKIIQRQMVKKPVPRPPVERQRPQRRPR